ncbi:hypothetical protein [Ralstonia pseudosolanacearum]|uniref:hypothetical protein n=1 Tax=Ralstonia pseudosolanacearum TaxID=1310165 RepID=UPI0020C75295|nr:hypothetical protein [Ralstonia pseudosolanacearum]
MLSSLRRQPASAMPQPARGSGAPFRPLALTARIAFAGVLTSGLGLPAFAQSVSKSATKSASRPASFETISLGAPRTVLLSASVDF